jgi:hypothetical protein
MECGFPLLFAVWTKGISKCLGLSGSGQELPHHLLPKADMRHGRPVSLEFPQRLTPRGEVKQQRQGFTGILKVTS